MTTVPHALSWRIHRLRAMDAAELAGRIREAVRRRTERIAATGLRGVRVRAEPADSPAIPPGSGAPAALKRALAEDAEALLAGRWKLFGWRDVEVDSPPDWHRDHMRGVTVPAAARRPDHRSLPGGADVRAIWEINRWSELTRLAMHGRLNGDDAAIGRAQEWLADWVRRNPMGCGVNWTSALEGGLRLVNFCWFDALARAGALAAPGIGQAQRALVDSIVPGHAWWVRRYLSFGSSANNHLLGELTGLLLAVRRWPELERITGAAESLWNEIAGCVLSQFAEDGGNREQALHYHLFAFEMALHACRAMNVADGPVVERLRRAAGFFVRMLHPREPWDFGDSDDAQIVPLPMRRDAAAAEWRAWMAGMGGGEAAGLGFWLGRSPVCEPQPADRTRGWWIAKESGMAVIERDGWKVRLDASPLGYGNLAAHGHCDALHVSVWDEGRALVIDPGTGGYFEAGSRREMLASWNAHNGPQPAGGFGAPLRTGTFLWTEHHARPALECAEGGARASFHHGGCLLSRWVGVDGDSVLIEDREMRGAEIVVRWLIEPGCVIREAGTGMLAILRDGAEWRMDFVGGRVRMASATVSARYGARSQSKLIAVTARGALRTRITRGRTPES